MKKSLAFALLTMGLILNVGAQTTPALAVVTVPVPDPGSTAVLLGLGFAALAAWHRKTN
jgi:VPDSG-CTERM motif/PEP-CTERM motif